MAQSDLRHRLERTSRRLDELCADLDDAALRLQFDSEFSPIGWHLGHVAWQEELWVLRDRFSQPPIEARFDEVFDAFRPDKGRRGSSLPNKSALLEYRREVRRRVLERFDQVIADGGSELMQGALLLRFIANHESQHSEIVFALRLAGGLTLPNVVCPLPLVRADARADWLLLAGGEFTLGTSIDPDRFDNEAPEHRTHVRPFQLQRTPVSNGAWLDFVTAGGYRDRALWSAEGWAWVQRSRASMPLYWSFDERDGWCETTLSGRESLRRERAVCHVCWYEAEAFANFFGARLPSEAEWEWAASKGSELRFMLGGVWQWTSDSFRPYPGFRPQAYRDYSHPWFDGRHRVARGGAFTTEPEVARVTFRNWYLPHVRRPFLGVRLAKDEV